MPNNSFKDTDIDQGTGNLSVSGDITLVGDLEIGGGVGSGGHNLFANNTGASMYGPVSVFGNLAVNGTITGDVNPAIIDLQSQSQTDDGTWSIDTDDEPLNYGTITQATTIGAPSDVAEGRVLVIRVKQGGGGSLTWNSIYRFWNFRSTLSATSSDVQQWVFIYNSVDSKWDCLSGPMTVDSITGTTATGTGAVVLATSPTLVTPTLGAATATSINLGNGVVGDLFYGDKGSLAVTGVTNVDSVTLNRMHWIRVGAVVSFTASVTVDCTAGASTATEFTIDPPVASNFANSADCCGDGVSLFSSAYYDCFVDADTTGDKIRVRFNSPTASSLTYNITANYTII